MIPALLLAASASAQTLQFNLKGTAGFGLLPGNEPGSITGGTGGEIGAGITYNTSTLQLTISNVGWGSSQGFTDLSSTATASHIHGPTTANNGFNGTSNFTQTAGTVFTLTRSSNAVSGGTFTNAPLTLPAAQQTDLLNGKWYINLHTTNNSGGEMRGFLVPVPSPVTAAASSITATGATLNGTVNAHGNSTTVTFSYGTTAAYGTNVAGTPSPVTGSTATNVSATLTGLTPNTTYHFRVNGESLAGVGNGGDLTFTTLGVPDIGVEQPAGTSLTDGVSGVDFGGVLAGASSPAKSFKITNTGSATLTLGTITIEGANAADFTAGTPGSNATATVTVNVEAAPPAEVINFNDFSIDSYGGRQDFTGTFFVENGGTTLRLTGNTWKKIDLPYTITANTVLEFDFSSTSQGEIHGIGFDTNDNITSSRTFQVYGTQNWGNRTFDNYSAGAGTVHYTIPVGQFYTGSVINLFFTNDHDVGNPTAESVFSNVRVYEASPVQAVSSADGQHVDQAFAALGVERTSLFDGGGTRGQSRRFAQGATVNAPSATIRPAASDSAFAALLAQLGNRFDVGVADSATHTVAPADADADQVGADWPTAVDRFFASIGRGL